MRVVQISDVVVTTAYNIVFRNLHRMAKSASNLQKIYKELRTITPAIELRKTEYAERYEVKLLLLLRRFQGSMQRPTIAATYPPRRIFCLHTSIITNAKKDEARNSR